MLLGIIKSIFNFLIENINIATFLIAALTFLITFANFYKNRAVIKCEQLDTSASYIIKPDFIDTENPDVYWQNDYRAIIDVIISNKSAKPISIIEFTINDSLKFNSYHMPGKEYIVTTIPSYEKSSSGVVFGFGRKEAKALPIGDQWIQPVLNIPPYSSIRGHLFFHFHEDDEITLGDNELKIITSRKVFLAKVTLSDIEKSRLPLPDSIEKARNQH